MPIIKYFSKLSYAKILVIIYNIYRCVKLTLFISNRLSGIANSNLHTVIAMPNIDYCFLVECRRML